MKKKLCTIVLLAGISGILSAQHVLRSELNLPRTGDVIVKQQVEYKDPGRTGENVLWDFGSLQPVNPEYKLAYVPLRPRRDSLYVLGCDTFKVRNVQEGELLIGREHRTMYYYRMKDSELSCLGYENQMSRMHYLDPLPAMHFPMNYGRRTEKPYRAECQYAQVLMSTHGKITLEADASGMMILPSGDTLKNVLRIHSLQTILSDSIAAMDSIHIDTQIENHKWYVKGYRYPVFETVKTIHRQDSVKDVFSTAFFFPPQEHYYLDDDSENLAVLDSLAQEDTPSGDAQQQSMSQWLKENFSYNFYPNPVVFTLYIEYHLAEAAEVGISVYNSATGISRHIPVGMKQAGYYYESFDCASLPPGTYVLAFNVRGEAVSNVIIKR
jgi:hypothetical protein